MGYIEDLEQKYEWLKNRIASAGKAAAAFSGGVDSVFLLYAAKEALGDQLLALTISLHAVPGGTSGSEGFLQSARDQAPGRDGG